MIDVKQIEGTDPKLYELVCRLVMDPVVLRQNNNYPFKTTLHFVWFVALDKGEVAGFLPVERRDGGKAVINNYYIRDESAAVLEAMIVKAQEALGGQYTLEAVAQTRDGDVFARNGFCATKVWKNYIKMTDDADTKRI